jgi:hypothetical protein
VSIEKTAFVEGEQIAGEIVTIYAAIACTYETKEVASYHLARHDALLGASGLGYSGPDGEVRPVLAIRLVDGRYALSPQLVEITKDPAAEAKLREAALKKLTPAERAALLGRSGT